MIQLASTKGSGSIEYTWSNPLTKKIEPKLGFLTKVNSDLLCNVGVYKQ